MKKIPTLFLRDPDDMRHVLPETTPGCEWVLRGEGAATRKYDGTCVLVRRDGLGHQLLMRREVKIGREPPANFIEVDHDPVTDKRVGWEPMAQTGWVKVLSEVLIATPLSGLEPGTYELCGPKVNRNPEGYPEHRLIRHADAEALEMLLLVAAALAGPGPLYEYLSGFMLTLGAAGIEGVVWHHPDGRMAKLKARDFR